MPIVAMHNLAQFHADWAFFILVACAKCRIDFQPNARFVAKTFAYIKDFQYLCSEIKN